MRNILLLLSGLLLLVFVLFVTAQTAQVVALAGAVHPAFGQGVLLLLLAAYALLLGVPVLLYLRLPRPLVPPAAEGGPEQARYLARLADRLAGNPRLRGLRIDGADRASVEAALEILRVAARKRVAEAAASVFVATAVSQSGRLDALVVLVAQTRLVWQVAHLYWQRPGLRELVRLYASVAAAVLVAQSVEELDVGEHLDEVMTAVLAGSALSAVPGFAAMAQVVIDSILEGTINAFLTLRVGCLAGHYCRSLTAPDRRSLRRSATAEAAAMLGEIALQGARVVSAATSRAAMRAARERSSEIGRVVVKGAEGVSAAAAEFAERAGVGPLASRLRGLAVTAAGLAAAVVGETARRGAAWGRPAATAEDEPQPDGGRRQ